ncbi:MAG: hypothetical protein APR56_03535 [Methanosaeta sp. SDB]|nr:MAG: hypothetical protein APR56_03535 [Methanosaeta sp. SDB]
MKGCWHVDWIEVAKKFWRVERLDPAAAFQMARCTEISGSERQNLEVDVAIEERISVVLDETAVADLFSLPTQLEELADGIDDLVLVRAEGKAVGAALVAGADLSMCALITTGRLSSAIVSKAARVRIPVLVSRAAPLNTGIELDRTLGMALAAFARRPNLYGYSGEERIS